ncbi:MAG: tetratricopeptide repeat protein, partial [Sedimentisphaerales bacterium]|nr:tetratricopeptide repeat protein [Sedimentisphaerales bacterium]
AARADDGFEVSLLFLQTAKFLARDAYGWAGDAVARLLALRPDSAMVQVLAAWVQEKQGNTDAAEAHYQAAMKLDSNGPMLRLMYGQSFLDRDPNKALEVLRGLWQHRQMRPWLVLIMWDVLRARDPDEKCAQMLEEALEVEPDNAYLWFNLGAVQWESERRNDGLASMAKAVELFPERGPLRGHLARLLEEEGRLDEAEDHFRRLLAIEPRNPVVYFWLARFLSKHRSDAADEALRTARKALTLRCDDPALEDQIRQLVREIRSERASKAPPASASQRDASSSATAR